MLSDLDVIVDFEVVLLTNSNYRGNKEGQKRKFTIFFTH